MSPVQLSTVANRILKQLEEQRKRRAALERIWREAPLRDALKPACWTLDDLR